MAEFMMQMAMKTEISGEEGITWEPSEVADVIRESLTKLYSDDEDYGEMIKIQILYISEYIRQLKPKIITEKITSYFHCDGLRHWFYIGYADDKGVPLKYDAVSVLSPPSYDISGVINLEHSITTKEGVFKVLGKAKFSTLKDTRHRLMKLTMPDNVKETMITPITSLGNHSVKRTIKRSEQPLLKKKSIPMKKVAPKKSGMATFLKIIAPGAGSLLLGGPSRDDYTINSNQQHTSDESNDDETEHATA